MVSLDLPLFAVSRSIWKVNTLPYVELLFAGVVAIIILMSHPTQIDNMIFGRESILEGELIELFAGTLPFCHCMFTHLHFQVWRKMRLWFFVQLQSLLQFRILKSVLQATQLSLLFGILDALWIYFIVIARILSIRTFSRLVPQLPPI